MIDVVYVGWPKSGSTWFYKWCQLQDRLAVAETKDKKMFLSDMNVGDSTWHTRNNNKVSVEIWHDYIFDFDSLKRAVLHNAGVKFLVFLREPLEWLESEYYYLVAVGECDEGFSNYISSEKFSYLTERLAYGKFLSRLYSIVPAEQVEIFLYEELREDPEYFQTQLLRSLAGDSEEQAVLLNDRVNARSEARLEVLKVCIRLAKRATSKSKAFKVIYDRIKGSRYRKIFFRSAPKKVLSGEEMAFAEEQDLVREAIIQYQSIRKKYTIKTK